MQSPRSAIDVVGRAVRSVSRRGGRRTIFIVSQARTAPRPPRRSGSACRNVIRSVVVAAGAPSFGAGEGWGTDKTLDSSPGPSVTRSTRKPRSGAAWLALALGVALLPVTGLAQTVEWVRSGGGTEIDRGFAITADPAGNTYVTGSFSGTAPFGPFTLTSAGSDDIFVAKYDGGGNVLWAQSAGGTSVDQGLAIAVDDSGNSYVTGVYSSSATFGSFTISSSAGTRDVFIVKYDGNGNALWARSAGGTTLDEGRGIAVDDAGNSYVTGTFSPPATFGSFTLTSGSIFVAK